MNALRHPDFINLKHKIQNCETMEKLERFRQVILRYGHTHSDRAELMSYFLEKEQDLNPEFKNESWADAIETQRMKDINNSYK